MKENNWPATLEVGLIGSCTNSSYEDMTRSASVAAQATAKNLKAKAEFTVTPGSELVRFTAERDGLLDDLRGNWRGSTGQCLWPLHWAVGAAHGRSQPAKTQSSHRSTGTFAKRNDGNASTHAFVASPEIVTALVIAGDLTFNPMTDTLTNEAGEQVKLDEPQGIEQPVKGYAVDDAGYQAPAEDGSGVQVLVSPTSDRLQLTGPVCKAWEGTDLTGVETAHQS